MNSICVLRLSALGDIVHVVGCVQALQRQQPQLKITWVISSAAYQFYKDLPGIEFIVFDKKQGLAGYWQLYKKLRGRRFDALIHCQTALRANLASLCIRATRKIGFDWQRAKELQWLMCNERIKHTPEQHLMDAFADMFARVGLQKPYAQWQMPILPQARAWAQQCIKRRPFLVLAPCCSESFRDWSAENYSQVVNYAQRRWHFTVALVGGTSSAEKKMAAQISAQCDVINLMGKTDLQQLYALIAQADLVLAPDTGPTHLAVMAGTDVIALYAVTQSRFSGPYRLPHVHVVDAYAQAMQAAFADRAKQQPWGKRIKDQRYMNLISAEQVCQALDKVMLAKQLQHQDLRSVEL